MDVHNSVVRNGEARNVSLFSDEDRQDCEDARREFLTPTDRVMLNRKIDSVRATLFEADMVLTVSQQARWSKTGYRSNNTWPLIEEKWPANTIGYQFGDPSPDKQMVLDAMEAWSTKTCIKFAEGIGNVLNIVQGEGCYTHVGYHSTRLVMSVSEVCDRGTVVHLLGHVIGLVHQHSRPDREQFVSVQYHNTALEDVFYFNYRGYDDCPYDYGSVMQFDAYGLSYNGESVFLGKTQNGTDEDGLVLSSILGTDWSTPSDSDAALVNREYGCPLKACSESQPKPAECNQHVVAGDPHFNRVVTFQSMMTQREAAISCVWKTEVPDSLACTRAAIAVTLSRKPDTELRRVWFVSGCRLFHVEIFDPDSSISYFYCAAQFARKPTKVFVSQARRIYGMVRLYPADWHGFQEAALGTGSVRFFNIRDFVCEGETGAKCM
ncbi:zinc metalloproteinase nas-4-like [Amphibalanus amphitrite]|uniref:zinc metalloproteinase nas-4-like n=1 Tax=Amphibalanus amphitrite TaxID=1232801 RepID=UPI001C903C9C|nr:zinc metalloproteinase nas-4-like [Amphibalanus amphitrite]